MRKILFGAFICLLLVACTKNKTVTPVPAPMPQLQLRLLPYFNSDSLCLDSTYVLNDGTLIQLTDLKCYLSSIGNGTTIWKDVALYDYRNKGSLIAVNNGVPADFEALSAGIGVPVELNNADPTLFPSTSPLNILNANDMHWGWNPGYVFIKIEGKADTLVDGVANFDLNFAYHIGTNTYYSQLNLPHLNWMQSGPYLYESRLKLDVKQIFDYPTQTIHLNTEFTTHSDVSESVLTEKIRQNFLLAITAL